MKEQCYIIDTHIRTRLHYNTTNLLPASRKRKYHTRIQYVCEYLELLVTFSVCMCAHEIVNREVFATSSKSAVTRNTIARTVRVSVCHGHTQTHSPTCTKGGVWGGGGVCKRILDRVFHLKCDGLLCVCV